MMKLFLWISPFLTTLIFFLEKCGDGEVYKKKSMNLLGRVRGERKNDSFENKSSIYIILLHENRRLNNNNNNDRSYLLPFLLKR